MSTPDGPSRPPLYRAEAVGALESSDRLDELLPVTSLRIWLLALAALVLVAGALAYAVVTPRNVTVPGSGRVVGNEGVTLVTATAAGQFGRVRLRAPAEVRSGQSVAEIVTERGAVPQLAQRNGTLLGYLVRPGDPIEIGTWLAEIANKVDDGRTALMIIEPGEAEKVAEGMPVTVQVTGGPAVEGVVGADRSGVLSPERIQEGLGLLEPPTGPREVISVKLDEPAPRGYEFTGTVLVSERTLLQQLLGMT